MNRQSRQSEGEDTAHNRSANSMENGGDEEQRNGGRGWHGNPQGHAAAGSKGGRKVSQNREHMASIGRKGGQTVSRDRQHMAEIGRKGGQSRTEGAATGDDNRADRER